MKKIGLTGGIASGKTTVGDFFKEKGVPFIDADMVARKVVEPGRGALKKIVALFGPQALLANGNLNRDYVGRIVFKDETMRNRLNEILHNPIRDEIEAEAKAFEEEGYGAIIYDIPLLIEKGWHHDMDEVWLVYCDHSNRVARLIKRNDYDREHALDRIASQMDLDEKRKYAQVIIDNSGSHEELLAHLQHLWEEKKDFFRKG